jgi:predicted CoA-binding protein
MKNIYNLKIVVVEIFRNSKYNFDIMFKLQESFAKCKWVRMCMKNEQSCDL